VAGCKRDYFIFQMGLSPAGHLCLETSIGPGGGRKDFTGRDEIFFFLEKFVSAVPGACFVKGVGKCFNQRFWDLFSEVCFTNQFRLVCLGRETADWVLVGGFRALKYDVRHTPIVIERIAKEWKLKRT
jgi:hypothetical protein